MTIPIYSDRGKISDLNKQKETEDLTSCEKRLKKLYLYATTYRDDNLYNSLGFITTDYIGNKSAIGLSLIRLKQIVNDIRSKSGSRINDLANLLASCFRRDSDEIYLDWFYKNKKIIKSATAIKPPSFRRI